jgi:hypothetical protein
MPTPSPTNTEHHLPTAFLVTLRPLPNRGFDAPPEVRLRRLLKAAARIWRFRCSAVVPSSEGAPDDNQRKRP